MALETKSDSWGAGLRTGEDQGSPSEGQWLSHPQPSPSQIPWARRSLQLSLRLSSRALEKFSNHLSASCINELLISLMAIRIFAYERDTVNNTIAPLRLFPSSSPPSPSLALHTILSINDRQKLIFPLDRNNCREADCQRGFR